jgi:hypothetical protein
LIVDADAELALPVAFKSFQTVPSECRQVFQAGCRIQAIKPRFCLASKT